MNIKNPAANKPPKNYMYHFNSFYTTQQWLFVYHFRSKYHTQNKSLVLLIRRLTQKLILAEFLNHWRPRCHVMWRTFLKRWHSRVIWKPSIGGINKSLSLTAGTLTSQLGGIIMPHCTFSLCSKPLNLLSRGCHGSTLLYLIVLWTVFLTWLSKQCYIYTFGRQVSRVDQPTNM